jgi:ribosome-binding protein aMBF1 (putative translation factor)
MNVTPCKVCGNEYDKPITVQVDGEANVYDCFECAIHDLAPTCTHCRVKIVGHGVEADGKMFCGAHCAGQSGVEALRDRA